VIRPRRLAALLAAAPLLAVSACATGDGTTLRRPQPGQTSPPPTTEPLDDDTLPSVALTTIAPGFDGPGVTVPVPVGADESTFTVYTPWIEGGPIEPIYTCDGLDVSPPVSWIGLPEGTSEIAVVFVDESTVQRDRPFVHWVLAGVQPSVRSLVEGRIPEGAYQGLNFFGNVWYDGPCPPEGEVHDYRLTVHALAEPLGLAGGTPAAEMIDTIEQKSLASVDVTGTAAR
jgi:Raf kinase inhibitor-like YbhB/YbcL family protein